MHICIFFYLKKIIYYFAAIRLNIILASIDSYFNSWETDNSRMEYWMYIPVLQTDLDDAEVKLLELDESHQSERTVFITPPEPPVGSSPSLTYTYHVSCKV